ncbi:taste receptor type 2 member 41-like [Pygocentrus nattereri]|uniref:taste receptor type 2 member 41-like n=1 Tax=Pygocentrus nattereri TaxID=42514 RepID=UPI001890E887|nr:taste receptor type 2 member 41-like [Pygocentrus nattereri]
MISINSSQWLNVFYCFQIIPVQRLYFVWLKKNLRIFISSALIVSAVVCLLGMSVNIADIEILFRYNDTDPKTDWIHLVNAQKSGFYMTLGLFCLSLCVMLASSSTTVVFLWRHLKNVGKNSGSFSSPRRQRHIRVTVISIVVQALLHVICSALVIIDELVIYVSPWYFDLGNNILCTIVSLYSFGTTINMSVSQSLFRQRTVYVWQKLFLPHSSSSVSTITQSPI